MTRKGVWNLQQVRDKQLKELWSNEEEVWTCGSNHQGELGIGKREHYAAGQNTMIDLSSPVQIIGDNSNWDDISISGSEGYCTVAAKKTDGTLWAWGNGVNGQLMHTGQNGPDGQRSSPIQIGSYTNVADFAVAQKSLMWINTSGELWGAGYNINGQLGQNDVIDRSSPIQIPGTTWRSIEGGSNVYLATKTDNTLWGWGYAPYGTLGQNTGWMAGDWHFSSPVQIPGTNWTSTISIGNEHGGAWALRTDGTLWAMGWGGQGQLGNNAAIKYSSPIQIPGDWTNCLMSKNDSSATNFLITKSDGTLWTCGNNNYGQLGLGNKTNYSSPIQVPGTYSTSIRPAQGGANGGTSVAVRSDGTAWGWGVNELGQLGQGSTTPGTESIGYSQLGSGVTWHSVGLADVNFAGIRNTLDSSQE